MYLGIEFGSTNIKAVKIDGNYKVAEALSYSWKSSFENGIWTYSLEEAWHGINDLLGRISDREKLKAVGISAMMHGYLAFDKDWNLLVPFRTWQNTITEKAAEELTKSFNFNIPQRWSVAHLRQAILNGEEHIDKIAHITTLSSYIHYMLTGENVIGIDDASGMFPIDADTLDYNQEMIDKMDNLIAGKGLSFGMRDILPKVLCAGETAGRLTEEGSARISCKLPTGILFAPPEGDGGTGMVATNSVSKRSGNVSAGTSIFAMAVLEKPLENLHTELDIVMTPDGSPVAMVHCNNCSNDLNIWIDMFDELLAEFGVEADKGELYTKLFLKSLEGDETCDGILCYNYMAGEVITGLNNGVPMVIRRPNSKMNISSFMRAQLYGTMATLRLGMDILSEEGVDIDCFVGHGGLFKTRGVCDVYMASALNVSVKCMNTSGEGGPYGMALLAAYAYDNAKLPLAEFLNKRIFADAEFTLAEPDEKSVNGFGEYMDLYQKGLKAEAAAAENL